MALSAVWYLKRSLYGKVFDHEYREADEGHNDAGLPILRGLVFQFVKERAHKHISPLKERLCLFCNTSTAMFVEPRCRLTPSGCQR